MGRKLCRLWLVIRKPSPLWRVAEQSEVGRGAVNIFVYFRISANSYCCNASSVSPSGCHLPQRGRLTCGAYRYNKPQFE